MTAARTGGGGWGTRGHGQRDNEKNPRRGQTYAECLSYLVNTLASRKIQTFLETGVSLRRHVGKKGRVGNNEPPGFRRGLSK